MSARAGTRRAGAAGARRAGPSAGSGSSSSGSRRDGSPAAAVPPQPGEALPRALPWPQWPRRAPGKPRACVTAGAVHNGAHAVSFSSPCSPCSGWSRCSSPPSARAARQAAGRRSRSRRARWPTRPPSGRGRRCWRRSATSASSSPSRRAPLTAIGFHGSNDGSLSLQPVGRQANAGLLERLWRHIAGSGRDSPRWYQLEGGPAGTNVLDVGTAPGTDVYAPVKGTVVAVSDLVIGGKRVGSRIDMRPSESPSVMVSVLNVRPDPSIAVGTPVLAASSKLGTAVDVAAVEKQALAAHASDGGNNVSISVYPSPGLPALARAPAVRRGRRRTSRPRRGRRAAPGAPRAPRDRRVRRQRREHRERPRDHATARGAPARRRCGRGDAREPHVASRGDRPVSRVVVVGRPARELPRRSARPRIDGRRGPRRHAGRGDQPPRVALPRAGAQHVGDRRRRSWRRLRASASVVLVDVHAEATSEKVALSAWLDGRVTAVLGTHTHVQTSDARILPGGTAALTDVGMTGPHDSVIGVADRARDPADAHRYARALRDRVGRRAPRGRARHVRPGDGAGERDRAGAGSVAAGHMRAASRRERGDARGRARATRRAGRTP